MYFEKLASSVTRQMLPRSEDFSHSPIIWDFCNKTALSEVQQKDNFSKKKPSVKSEFKDDISLKKSLRICTVRLLRFWQASRIYSSESILIQISQLPISRFPEYGIHRESKPFLNWRLTLNSVKGIEQKIQSAYPWCGSPNKGGSLTQPSFLQQDTESWILTLCSLWTPWSVIYVELKKNYLGSSH